MQIYLAVTPTAYQEASRYCRSLAHVAYRIGEGSALLRQDLLLQTQGGLLAVTDRDAPVIDSPDALCAAVLRECGRRSYTGVLLDFEGPLAPDRAVFATRLCRALPAGHPLYVPESYARQVPGAVALICTALSGGSFSQRLQEAADTYGGAGRLALDIQRLRMDFRLPARSGEGVPLGEADFRSLTERERPAVFFSRELCARYFTYTREGDTHFVLFDDSDTLLRKVRAGEALGFSAAFFMWPEVRDLASALFRRP